MNRIKMTLCATGLSGLAVFVTYSWAQDDFRRPQSYTVETRERKPAGFGRRSILVDDDFLDVAVQSPPPMRTRIVTETIHAQRPITEPIPPEELAAMTEFQNALQALKAGKDEGEKKKAVETIQKQLTSQFEKDLAQREQELATVEERVKSLRQQLEKRKLARNEIIELRFKTVVNNADGLGFPGEDGPIDPNMTHANPLAKMRHPDSPYAAPRYEEVQSRVRKEKGTATPASSAPGSPAKRNAPSETEEVR